jgi:hypothetical protein
MYFFQNNVVPQFLNGMICWHYVHVYKIIKQLFQGTVKTIDPRCWRRLENCCLFMLVQGTVKTIDPRCWRWLENCCLFMLVQGTVKIIVPRCWRWLGNCCLRPQAPVLKSSPAPRVNSFDCSLNNHEITVYYKCFDFDSVIMFFEGELISQNS